MWNSLLKLQQETQTQTEPNKYHKGTLYSEVQVEPVSTCLERGCAEKGQCSVQRGDWSSGPVQGAGTGALYSEPPVNRMTETQKTSPSPIRWLAVTNQTKEPE